MSILTVVLIELASTTSTIVVFSCALSFALSLSAFSTPPYATLNSADLSFFARLDPLSRALTITSALTGLLLILTLTASLVNLHNRRTESHDIRFFEPTISALGMSHGFHALYPQPTTAREAIPTMYDPYKSFRRGFGGLSNAKDARFASEGA